MGTQGSCKGGIFYIDDSTSLSDITISDTDITSTTCTSGSGGVIYINQIYSGASIKISGYNQSYTGSVFSADTQGSFLYSSGYTFKLTIQSALFQCYASKPSITSTTAIGSAFYIIFPSSNNALKTDST